jgi:hypothetical protein
MTDQHPVIPPLELRAKWITEARFQDYCSITEQVADRDAQWGADQELEATLAEVSLLAYRALADRIRAARRPKPQTQAEIALEQYDRCVSILEEKGYSPAGCIRAALERLKQVEDSND